MKLELMFAGVAIAMFAGLMVMLGNGCATTKAVHEVTTADAGPAMLGVDVQGEFDPSQNQICIYVASVKKMRCMSPAEFSARMEEANDRLNLKHRDDL